MVTWGVFSWTVILLRNFSRDPCWTCIKPWSWTWISHRWLQFYNFICFLHRVILMMVFLHKLGVGVDFLESCFCFGLMANLFHFWLPCYWIIWIAKGDYTFLHDFPVWRFSSCVLVLSVGFGLITEVDIVDYTEWVERWFVRFFDYLKGINEKY